MRYCHNCGASIFEEGRCIECGLEIAHYENVNPAQKIKINRNNETSKTKEEIFVILGITFGTLSIFTPIFLLDTMIGIMGLIFSIMSLKSQKNTIAIIGVVISSYAIIYSFIWFLLVDLIF